ncbi:efflux RND transporter permease subunit [Planctomicrobium piriforme]|uniref:Multidrug efflux pump subunit AcrB n=1 Tax=Planctomicrobium piriforme TaxID=1576369 RepID=A0A1I3PS20_9PLAN|nr:efflux RND transporter permease subunit [Planctomicrobium piriforme]SFJ24418.1 Multidrug efflux pump subunit AcrB [Planctomicrobium piriforme]
MWIVRLALQRPYTFVVMAMLIAILGTVTVTRMPTDIFPEIDIPVIAVIWNYTGISPDDMETRIVGNFERILVSTVNGIEHIESQSLNGISVVKIFLQPGSEVDAAVSQTVASSQTALRNAPQGTFPPLVMRYSASNVPIVQLSLGSESLNEQQLFDLATNSLRPGMASVPGAQVPYPYGGKVRQVMVDIDPVKLFAWKLSANDVASAVNAQNLVLPAGTAKIGTQEYNVRLNSSPDVIAALGDLPVRTVGGRTIYVRDVASVRDGFTPQTNIVRVDGQRGVLQPIYKAGASTLQIVGGVRERLPQLMDTMPKALNMVLLSDQSIFVRAALEGVVHEAAIAAGLTAAMILLFLGSWRSTLIVIISIPLSIFVSIIMLDFLGYSLNVMTLGGMALAVGILVDDATVEIENIHRNLHQRKHLVEAILDGAQQIAVPAFVSTLSICIVFVPVAFITGAAKSLFVPLALAVVFAMMTSYFLSRTLVPTMIHYLLAAEVELYGGAADDNQHHKIKKNLIWRVHEAFNRQFDRLKEFYGLCLSWALAHRVLATTTFLLFVTLSSGLYFVVGRDFFPTVDAGQIRLHVRAPPGTRIEETERYFGQVSRSIREHLPEHEIVTIVENIGIPNSGINLALSDGALMSAADGEILIRLAEHHSPTEEHIDRLRQQLNDEFPDLTFFFQPPDIATQILNFGLPAPIDVQLVGPRGNMLKNYEIAKQLRDEISRIPGAVDVHVHQVPLTPELYIESDRTLLSQMGLSQRQVASDLLVSLSSNAQAAPNYWLDPRNGVQYTLAVQTPQVKIDSIDSLTNTPVTPVGATQPQLLGNLAQVKHRLGPTNVTHYNIAVSFDVLAGVQGADLGRVSGEINKLIEQLRPNLPRGTTITVRGQVESMNSSFRGLAFGLVFAVVLVYLLMVVNFQSWLDPMIILMALPGAVSGILWMLFLTGTTLNVPSLMGSIMCIGVATANSILLITFANDQRKLGKNAHDAAWAAGVTRLRPVMMTALAMIIGMLPMAIGMGEGGEQNAPLGRAVIGGLSMATLSTLFFVPIVYSALRTKAPVEELNLEIARYDHAHGS